MYWMLFNIYLLTFNLFATLGLGAFVYLRKSTRPINRAFWLFSLNVAIWTFLVLMVQTSLKGAMLVYWGRLIYVSVVFIPSNFYFFILTLGQRKLPRLRNVFLPYASALFFGVISSTSLVIKGYEIDVTGRIRAVYGPVFPAVIAYLSTFMGMLFLRLAREMKLKRGIQKLQFQYIFFGILIVTSLSICTGLIAPLLGITVTELASLAPTFGLLWSSIIAYAIFKYHIMDITIVIKRTTLYAMLTASITAAYIALVLISNFLFGGIVGVKSIIPAMIAALLIAFAFAPLKEGFQVFIDKTLFKKRYDHRKILSDLSRILTSIFNLDYLLSLIIKVITQAMGIGSGAIYLPRDSDGTYVVHASWSKGDQKGSSPRIGPDDPLVARLLRTRRSIIREQLERMVPSTELKAIGSLLDRSGIAICVPIFLKNTLTGMLFLGYKETGEPFTSEDIEMFTTLSHHIGVAVENARLYTKVEESRIYQEILLNNLTSGVVAIDLNGRITTFNRKAEEILEKSASRIIGGDVASLAPGLKKPLLTTLRQKDSLSNDEVTLRVNGKEVPLAVSSSTFKSQEGKTLGALIVFSDLTERKILEMEMRRADRLASLGTLAAGMAHEIKNPLVSLKTFTQLLPEKYADREFRESFSKLAAHEVDRINHLVEQLLDFARPATPTFRETDLCEVLDKTLLLLKNRLMQQCVKLVKEFRETPLIAKADGDQLTQVFINIMINGMQSMEGGGTLTVVAEEKKAEEAGPRLRAARGRLSRGGASRGPADWALIEIGDEGKGIAPKDIPHLFDPFFTTKGTGVGLGLAIAHSIVQEHGGIIEVRSTPGVGTTFLILLPLARGVKGKEHD